MIYVMLGVHELLPLESEIPKCNPLLDLGLFILGVLCLVGVLSSH